MRADMAGISREHMAAAGRMDTSLAAMTDLIRNAGEQIARTGAGTNDSIGALVQHLGQQQAGRDAALIEALQRLNVVQDNRQVHVDARTAVDARQASQTNVLAQDNRRVRQTNVPAQDNRSVQLNQTLQQLVFNRNNITVQQNLTNDLQQL